MSPELRDGGGSGVGLQIQAAGSNGSFEDESNELIGPESADLVDDHAQRCTIDPIFMLQDVLICDELGFAGEIGCIGFELSQTLHNIHGEVPSPYCSARICGFEFTGNLMLVYVGSDGLKILDFECNDIRRCFKE